ncbi:MAG: hypothetical protein ACLFSU_05990 [Acholeplasmataceae bacterium]
MRVFNRILFAFIAAIGLYLVFNASYSYAVTLYMETEGQEALDRNDYAFFISTRYYDANEVISDTYAIDDMTFLVKVYSVANVVEDEERVVDGIFVLMHQTDGAPLEEPFGVEVSSSVGDIEVSYMGIKIPGLPIYSFIIPETETTLITRERFTEDGDFQDIDRIDIYRDDKDIGSIDLLITSEDFTLREPLEDYLEETGDAPTEGFKNVAVMPRIEIDTSTIVIRSVIIYSVFVFAVMVGLFFIRKKRMGRGKPTEGIRQDIEKLTSNKDK